MIYKFFDANGVEWNWDSEEKRVYVVEAEKEDEIFDGTHQNGEYIDSLEKALQYLEESGFMFKEKE